MGCRPLLGGALYRRRGTGCVVESQQRSTRVRDISEYSQTLPAAVSLDRALHHAACIWLDRLRPLSEPSASRTARLPKTRALRGTTWRRHRALSARFGSSSEGPTAAWLAHT